ncbi:MAG: SAM-dependent methyltransferase [Nitrospira sp.]|nr:SAM-dependent methyltransferase [Nitrospira sp.]MCP9443166.1 SAM-dependent methyltransferase [Nitrospira sp.]
MSFEQSQQNSEGILSLVAVPIGHADDITLRALHVLRDADLIVSEDPAATRRLLAHHGIDTALTSYGPTDIKQKAAVLLDRLKQGKRIVLVSDCGSPMIADPGSILVAAAHAHGIRVVSIPGPSALTAAISVAGLATDDFLFLGQLPDTKQAIRHRLAGHLAGETAIVAFCPVESLSYVLRAIAETAPRRHLTLACDLTTPHERTLRGTAHQIQHLLAPSPPFSNLTLVISGKTKRNDRRRTRKAENFDQSLSSRRISTR